MKYAKQISALSAVVLIIAAGTPGYISKQVDQDLRQMIDAVNQNPMYQAELVEHHKGWFKSESKVRLSVDLSTLTAGQPQDAQQDWPDEVSTVLDLTTQHGPILPGKGLGWVGWELSYSGDTLGPEIERDPAAAFYHLSAVTGFTLDTRLTDHMQAFTTTLDGDTVQFSGYQGSGEIHNRQLSYIGKIASVKGENAEAGFVIENLVLDITTSVDIAALQSGQFFDSAGTLSVENMQVSTVDMGDIFVLNNFALITRMAMEEASELAELNLDYQADSLQVADATYRDLLLKLEINRISADFMRGYQEYVKTVYAASPEQIAAHTETFLADSLPLLLAQNPELKISELTATLPTGILTGDMRLQVEGVDALPARLDDSGFWFQHLVVDANLSADKPLAEEFALGYMQGQIAIDPAAENLSVTEIAQIAEQQTPVMLENLEQQGLIKASDDKYQIALSLKNGEANLNGTVISLPMGAQ